MDYGMKPKWAVTCDSHSHHPMFKLHLVPKYGFVQHVPAWFYCFSIAVEVLTLLLTSVQIEWVSSSKTAHKLKMTSETFILCQYQTCHEFGLLSRLRWAYLSCVCYTKKHPGWTMAVRQTRMRRELSQFQPCSSNNFFLGERRHWWAFEEFWGIRLEKKRKKRIWPKSSCFTQTMVNCCTCILFLHSPFSKIRSQGNTVYLLQSIRPIWPAQSRAASPPSPSSHCLQRHLPFWGLHTPVLELAPLLLHTEEEAGQVPAGDHIAPGTEPHSAGNGLAHVVGSCRAADSGVEWECQGEEWSAAAGGNDSSRDHRTRCRWQAPS